MSMFQKATKRAVRARIALDGPSGGGKTWTALTFARCFGKRTALVDTERGSASLYADQFDFDVSEMSPPYHPQRLIELIVAAEKARYDTLVIDSLSHFWEGEGGTLDIVDAAAARAHGNSWAGWKSGTPVLRHLIDTMLGADLHIVATMRSKTEWVIQEKTNREGRSVSDPVRLGMAPVMRAGVEYEFTLVGDLNLDHQLTISKSRASILADQVIQPGRAHEAAEAFVAWMNAGEPMATREEIDALKAGMNRIEPREDRLAAKEAFAQQFGNPDYLLASKVEAANAFVAGLLGAPPAEPEPEPAPPSEPEPETASADVAPAPAEAAPEPQPAAATPETPPEPAVERIGPAASTGDIDAPARRVHPIDDRLLVLMRDQGADAVIAEIRAMEYREAVKACQARNLGTSGNAQTVKARLAQWVAQHSNGVAA